MNHLSATEQKIIGAIIDNALDLAMEIAVWDGEAWACAFTDDRDTLQDAIGATDTTMLRFRLPGHYPVGNVLLVHGNDCDVIADYTDNLSLQAILATALAEQLSGVGA